MTDKQYQRSFEIHHQLEWELLTLQVQLEILALEIFLR